MRYQHSERSGPRGVLRIHLFGGARVAHGSEPHVRLPPVLQTLLAYLLVERNRSHPRETLAGLFWGDHPEDRARGCLNTALWRLRAVIEPTGTPRGTYLISTVAGDVGFNARADHWLDVAVFEREVTQIVAHPAESIGSAEAATLEGVMGLYTGDPLDGCFDDWAVRERERLRRLRLGGLEHLMRYHRHHGARERSIAYAEEVLRHDALREDVHREIMEIYWQAGQRTRAMQQYAACRETLDRELGIPPSEGTRAIYSRLVGESAPAVAAVAGQSAPGSNAVSDLRAAARDLGEAVEHMRVAHAAFACALERIGELAPAARADHATRRLRERAERAR